VPADNYDRVFENVVLGKEVPCPWYLPGKWAIEPSGVVDVFSCAHRWVYNPDS